MPLNRAEILRALGEVDDVIVGQIIASDATVAELAEAQAWVLNNEPLLNRGKSLPTGRVGQLAKILSKLEEQGGAGSNIKVGAGLRPRRDTPTPNPTTLSDCRLSMQKASA
jgi:hypothetical protein